MTIVLRMLGSLVFACIAGMAAATAAPVDSPDTIYVDGRPCGSFCQAAMGLSREYVERIRDRSRERQQARVSSHSSKEASQKSRPRTATRKLAVAKSPVIATGSRRSSTHLPAGRSLPFESADREGEKKVPAVPSAEAAVTQPVSPSTGAERSVAISPDREPAAVVGSQDVTPSGSQGEVATVSPHTEVAPSKPKSDAQVSGDSFAPQKPVDSKSVDNSDHTVDSGTDENAIAAPTTAVAPTLQPDHEDNVAAIGPPREALTPLVQVPALGPARRVAVIMARPEIASISGLASKDIAIDARQFAVKDDVRTALTAAGASGTRLSDGDTKALDRLIGGEVAAAVLAVLSTSAADNFPSIAGFRLFRVPLASNDLNN